MGTVYDSYAPVKGRFPEKPFQPIRILLNGLARLANDTDGSPRWAPFVHQGIPQVFLDRRLVVVAQLVAFGVKEFDPVVFSGIM